MSENERVTQVRRWDLGDGCIVALSIPMPLSRANLEKLRRYADVLEIEASISWEPEEPEETMARVTEIEATASP